MLLFWFRLSLRVIIIIIDYYRCETGSYEAPAGLKLMIQWRVALNFANPAASTFTPSSYQVLELQA